MTKIVSAFSIILFIMIETVTTYSQSSLDMFGNSQSQGNRHFRLNSLEANPNNFTQSKDWEISFGYGGEYINSLSSNIYMISLSKRIGSHYLYGRFTPGIQKDFLFNTGTSIISEDSTEIELQTKIHYEEKFGLGYAFNISERLTAGFNLRYFKQEFSVEELDPFIKIDTTNYLITKSVETQNNFWKGDIGFSYLINEKLNVSFSSVNLFILNEGDNNTETEDYNLKNDKTAELGINYYPEKWFSFLAKAESNSSFYAGFNFSAQISSGLFSAGLLGFHDKYQEPFIAGVVPALNYSTDLFSLTISSVQYFEDRNKTQPLSKFLSDGMRNVLNNPYSGNKIFANISFALTFTPEKLVEFVDVTLDQEIFPTLTDEYIHFPFATATVKNVTDKEVIVKPSSIIPLINDEVIHSPSVILKPGETKSIPFFTIIQENSANISKRQIGNAKFYLTTKSSQPDDEIQKPVLINDHNAWDGKVINLRYFVRKDIADIQKLAKEILQSKKAELESSPSVLTEFAKVKILFERFAENMIYVSDPRASVERVQFPKETLQIKGGDCDDLSVCLSSMLESVGIQTAFVDFKEEDGVSHVNLLVNTALQPENANLITINDKKFFIRKNVTGKEEIWIPIETTALGNFENAWDVASEKFHTEAVTKLGLSKGNVEIIDIY